MKKEKENLKLSIPVFALKEIKSIENIIIIIIIFVRNHLFQRRNLYMWFINFDWNFGHIFFFSFFYFFLKDATQCTVTKEGNERMEGKREEVRKGEIEGLTWWKMKWMKRLGRN